MNQTTAADSRTGSSLLPDSIGTITSAHFVLIAVLAVLVILGILWGARLNSRRKAAEREVIAHNEELAPAVEERAAEKRVARTESKPAPESEPTPVPAPASAPAPTPLVAPPPAPLAPAAAPIAATGEAELTQLKGLGPKVAARLAELSITTLPQLAALTDDQAAALDAQLGPFTGRLTRDRWVEQARFLATGDRAGFEAVFGRL